MTHMHHKFIVGSVMGIAGLLFILVASLQAADAEQTALVPNLPNQPYNYANPVLPPYYTQGAVAAADNTPNNNPVTDAGATLGRVLFYDKMLSANGTVACASCHVQAEGFSDSRQFSVGFEGELTGRNSMGLANARYYNNGHFFWDERATTLEEQVLMPIQDSVEMGMTLEQLVATVSSLDYYPELFEDAFGTPQVTSGRISSALAQFVRSMVSTNSKYDRVLQNQDTFTTQEALGRDIFFTPNMGGCAACHGTDAQIAPGARNNGLDLVFADNGLGDVTGNPADDGKFKVPSLRNIELTAPYMHDGRFATLEEVVQFYNNGIQDHPNLDPALQTPDGRPRRLRLSPNEQAALVAFLKTLTDPTLVTDPKFSDPFIEIIEIEATDFAYMPVVISGK